MLALLPDYLASCSIVSQIQPTPKRRPARKRGGLLGLVGLLGLGGGFGLLPLFALFGLRGERGGAARRADIAKGEAAEGFGPGDAPFGGCAAAAVGHALGRLCAVERLHLGRVVEKRVNAALELVADIDPVVGLARPGEEHGVDAVGLEPPR